MIYAEYYNILLKDINKADMVGMLVLPALRRLRQEDHKFKTILGYIVRPNLTIHVFFLKRHERKCK
jgi:hypothetical protein